MIERFLAQRFGRIPDGGIEVNKYCVMADDNFHYMDEDERSEVGRFETADEALAACRKIVDDFLAENFKPGLTAEALYDNYTSFGGDPFIVSDDPGAKFSAWTYAKARCAELCGEKSRAAAMRDRAHQNHPPGPSVAEVSALHTTAELLSLIEGPSPADPNAVAVLLERWLDVEPKPVAHSRIGGIGYSSSEVFLQWLVLRVGHAGFQVLGAADRDLARRFAEGFLTHANAQIHFYKTSTGAGGIGLGIRAALARRWENLKVRLLGFAGMSDVSGN